MYRSSLRNLTKFEHSQDPEVVLLHFFGDSLMRIIMSTFRISHFLKNWPTCIRAVLCLGQNTWHLYPPKLPNLSPRQSEVDTLILILDESAVFKMFGELRNHTVGTWIWEPRFQVPGQKMPLAMKSCPGQLPWAPVSTSNDPGYPDMWRQPGKPYLRR